ncbi:hypothetical protein METUNv1_01334 [Methyloversatilis universalis FAM5]|uniref:Uncharacterized protein n=1 Tax=Methyloversatilis universalis (strain ATCC BAA-1314 / DSM 25237 / JCM 13912 / CCUG 52030 / FAM5) TaxID=1000565 RepID=F5RAQ0_METUF|nr:hypothetical protein METUNv1_01334 [Methyloversatilis universalis FAM5]
MVPRLLRGLKALQGLYPHRPMDPPPHRGGAPLPRNVRKPSQFLWERRLAAMGSLAGAIA